jgi:hypothetical protein
MNGPRSRLAETREFLFRRIAAQRGGARGALLAQDLVAQAEGNLQAMIPAVIAEVEATIDDIRALAEARTTAPQIWSGVHDLRGLAGTFGMAEVGLIAGAIRLYGQDWPDGFEPDWPFLQTLTTMLSRAFHHPGELPLDMLATACEEAVADQLAREGRPVYDAELVAAAQIREGSPSDKL